MKGQARAPKTDTAIRKRQIVQAAVDLVAKRGLTGFSVAELARRVGLSAAGIYRHFSSKEDILDAVVDLVRSSMTESVLAARGEGKGALDTLKLIMNRHLDMVMRNPGIPRVLLSDRAVTERPSRKARVQGVLNEVARMLEETVASGQESGELRKDLPARSVADVIMAVIRNGVFRWHMSDGQYDMKRYLDGAWKVVSAAVK